MMYSAITEDDLIVKETFFDVIKEDVGMRIKILYAKNLVTGEEEIPISAKRFAEYLNNVTGKN